MGRAVADRVFAVRRLRAVNRASGKQRGHLCNGDAKDLLLQNVVDALLPVGNFIFQSHQQALRNLAQKHARFAEGIDEARVLVSPKFCR